MPFSMTNIGGRSCKSLFCLFRSSLDSGKVSTSAQANRNETCKEEKESCIFLKKTPSFRAQSHGIFYVKTSLALLKICRDLGTGQCWTSGFHPGTCEGRHVLESGHTSMSRVSSFYLKCQYWVCIIVIYLKSFHFICGPATGSNQSVLQPLLSSSQG